MATNQIYISEILSVHLARILNPSTSFFLSFGAVIVYTLGYVINVGTFIIKLIINQYYSTFNHPLLQ